MMTTEKRSITSRDPRGLSTMERFAAGYNSAGLTADQAQSLIENGEYWGPNGEFVRSIKEYAELGRGRERVDSGYIYPTGPRGYKGLNPIAEQIKWICEIFDLDPTEALNKSENLPPSGMTAEGWVPIPKESVIIAKYLSTSASDCNQHFRVIQFAMDKLKEHLPHVKSCFEIYPDVMMRQSKTFKFLKHLEKNQKGEIMLIPAQFGMRHRGKSIKRARETFAKNEFGFGAFEVICMALVNPRRFGAYCLNADCPGDTYIKKCNSDTPMSLSLMHKIGKIRLVPSNVTDTESDFGSVSGILPYELMEGLNL